MGSQCLGVNTSHYQIYETVLYQVDGLMQDCGISIANALELPQSFT